MADDHIHLHAAKGRVFLHEIRTGRELDGLAAINVMRWRDEAGQVGQDTHVRLALHVERGGELFIEHDGEVSHLVVGPDDRFLRFDAAPGAERSLQRLDECKPTHLVHSGMLGLLLRCAGVRDVTGTARPDAARQRW